MPYKVRATALKKWFVGFAFEGVAQYGKKHAAITIAARVEAEHLAHHLGPEHEVVATDGTLADA